MAAVFFSWFSQTRRSFGVSVQRQAEGAGAWQYPVITLADARLRRDAAKRLLADGVDPSVQRQTDRRATQLSSANTFKTVADELMKTFKAEGDAPTTLKKKQLLLDFANAEFGKRPIAEIKAPEILDALRKIEKRGRHETVTRARSTVGANSLPRISTSEPEFGDDHPIDVD